MVAEIFRAEPEDIEDMIKSRLEEPGYGANAGTWPVMAGGVLLRRVAMGRIFESMRMTANEVSASS